MLRAGDRVGIRERIRFNGGYNITNRTYLYLLVIKHATGSRTDTLMMVVLVAAAAAINTLLICALVAGLYYSMCKYRANSMGVPLGSPSVLPEFILFPLPQRLELFGLPPSLHYTSIHTAADPRV